MQPDLFVKISDISSVLESFFVGISFFSEAIDEVVKQLEGGMDVGVFVGQFALIFEERMSGKLVDLLDSFKVMHNLFHNYRK